MKYTNAEVYDVRSEKYPGEWAVVTIQEEIGLFSAYSSYGHYAYQWNNHGSKSVKEFVQNLDYDYFFEKTAHTRGKVFCPDTSFQKLKKVILEARREKCIDKVEAECAWHELKTIDHLIQDGLIKEEAQFISHIWSLDDLCNVVMSYDTNVVCYKKDPDCVGFWEKLWPEILKALREG